MGRGRRKATKHKTTKRAKHSGRGLSSANPAAENAILNVFEDTGEPVLPISLVTQEADWPSKRSRELGDAINSLVSRGLLKRVKGQRLRRIERGGQTARGRLSMVADKSFGFVRQEKGDDLFVGPRGVRGARHGDLVEVELGSRGRFGRTSATVIRVIERSDKPIVGVFRDQHGGTGFVYPDDPKMLGPIKVSASDTQNASDRDRVEVKMISSRNEPRGRIVRQFGRQDDPDARFHALIAENKFRETFPEPVNDEVEGFTEEMTDRELESREDLRDRIVFTIDPVDAKDYDDALSLKKTKKGYELGVHIADVSWYVRPGSKVDEEARLRGTSVYTSHGTLPMLPERLSSDLCSLREGVLRRTFSVFMQMTPDGRVVDHRLTRSVIRSAKRFTYRQAQDIIDKTDKKYGAEELPGWRSDRMNTVIAHLARLTRRMRALRFEHGGLELDVPEHEVELDDAGKVVGIHKREVIEANHLVEECMLAANKAVTEYAVRKRGAGPKVFIYRVHDKPDPDAIEDFAMFVEGAGLDWPFGWEFDQLPSRQLNQWLQSLSDHPLADVVRKHALRAMAKAVYDIENIGHYGLGFKNYTHFTSPIRRYPDLVVHRILLDDLEGTAKYGKDRIDDVRQAAESSSERERAAQTMERDSLKIRQAEFFQDQIGQVFDGMVTNAIPKGVFVEIGETGADGMISAEDLGEGAYFDRRIQGFVDRLRKEAWRPGTRMQVRVVQADEQTGRVDLEPA